MIVVFLLVAVATASSVSEYPMSLNALNLNGSIDSFVLPVYVESLPISDPWFVRLATWQNTNLVMLPGFLERVMEDKVSESVSSRLSSSDIWTGPISAGLLPGLPVGAVGSLGCGPVSSFVEKFPTYSIRSYLDEHQPFTTISLEALDCAPSYYPLKDDSSWRVGAFVDIKVPIDSDGEVWKRIQVPVDSVEVSNRPTLNLDPTTWEIFSLNIFEQVGGWHTDAMGRLFTDDSSKCHLLVIQQFPRISMRFNGNEAEYEIGPEQYVLSGSPRDPYAGCTINVIRDSAISTGSPFLMNHAIEFDAIHKRLGIC